MLYVALYSLQDFNIENTFWQNIVLIDARPSYTE